MKLFFYFNVLILCSLFWGCTTTNANPSQSIQQTCTSTPIDNKESKEKQCCLKDTLVVQRLEEVCALYESEDSVSNTLSSNISINPSSPLDFSKSNEYHGLLDYLKEENNDSRKGCFGANCLINNIYVEHRADEQGSLTSFGLVICKIWNRNYIIFVLGDVILITILFSIISFFSSRSENKSIKKSVTNDRPEYKILSPVYNVKISEETEKQLKFAILNDDDRLKNIAITGPYGSGKSSTWKTFCKNEKINEKKRIVEISLSKFEDSKLKNIVTVADEQEIEKTVIQQLFYSRRKGELKYSIFPQISSLTSLKTIVLTIVIFVFVSLILPLTNESLYCIAHSWADDLTSLDKIHISLSVFALSFIFYLFLFWVVQKIYNLRISKICLKDVEIKLDNGESFFNKYLAEIFYFFETTKCDCVVIEDLDRFNSSKIFTKLREINLLVNNNPTIRAGIRGPIKFVYIVRDNIFSKYERTKFFDFIIPIVPVFNGDNATSYIKENFLREDPLDFFNDKPYLSLPFLEDIQKYLDDLRLIINCFNEFKIYKEVNQFYHGKNGDEKLFALILYKNLYPKDFQELLRQRGVLYYCLNNSAMDVEKKKINESDEAKND